MKRSLYLHIGSPKTATSSIQHFLYEERDWLKENGYHYVETGMNHRLQCHHDLVWRMGLNRPPSFVTVESEEPHGILDELVAEISHLESNLIISSELLFFVEDYGEIEPLLEAVGDRDIYIVLFVRRQDRFLESLYQQIIKDGGRDTFDKWYEKSKSIGYYDKLLDRLDNIVPPENILLDIFEPEREDYHPIRRFLSLIGLEEVSTEVKKIENIRKNESLSIDEIEEIRLSNMTDLSKRFKLIREFQDRAGEKRKRFLSEEHRDEIISFYRESNERFARMGGMMESMGDWF